MTEMTVENATENTTDISLIELADFFVENVGSPATANDILKMCPEIGTRKKLFALLEDLAHENLVQGKKEGTKNGHPLTQFIYWIADDSLAYDLWKKYLRNA